MKDKIKINENERKVLEKLVEAYEPEEWGAYGFKSLSLITELEIKAVRRSCRSLAKKGLAAYERTLWSDDGPAGAGYRATEKGAEFIEPCDVCGRRATFDYMVDDSGNHELDKGFNRENTHRVRECDDHYKLSKMIPQQKSLI